MDLRVRLHIKKAVIPVAGLGTRLRPLSAVVPKAMMPVPSLDGRVLPVLHHVLAEAKAAGVEEAAVVVSPPHEAMIRAYLAAATETARAQGTKLRSSAPPAEGSTSLAEILPAKVKLIVQEKPLGFGHAVWLGKKFVGKHPFLVMLGDHIQAARAGRPACAAQVARAFAQTGGAAMIGVQPVGPEELPRVGVAGGKRVRSGVFRCTDFVEKPDLATARARLKAPGLKRDHFLAHCGIYAFTPEIFGCLEDLMDDLASARRKGEVQLADAQSILLRRHPDDYYLAQIDGRAYDTGTPAGYVATLKALLPHVRTA
jgi:UTP--glucose-1-phosphate uridylyltransferase